MLMGFNEYLLAVTIIESLVDKKDLNDMQRYVLSLHVATNLTNPFCKNHQERSTPQRHI